MELLSTQIAATHDGGPENLKEWKANNRRSALCRSGDDDDLVTKYEAIRYSYTRSRWSRMPEPDHAS